MSTLCSLSNDIYRQVVMQRSILCLEIDEVYFVSYRWFISNGKLTESDGTVMCSIISDWMLFAINTFWLATMHSLKSKNQEYNMWNAMHFAMSLSRRESASEIYARLVCLSLYISSFQPANFAQRNLFHAENNQSYPSPFLTTSLRSLILRLNHQMIFSSHTTAVCTLWNTSIPMYLICNSNQLNTSKKVTQLVFKRL